MSYFQSGLSTITGLFRPKPLTPKQHQEKAAKEQIVKAAEKQAKLYKGTIDEKTNKIKLLNERKDIIEDEKTLYNNIFWIRHAESCSNRASIVDAEKIGKVLSSIGSTVLSTLLSKQSDASVIIEEACGDKCKQPPLSLLGILQAQYLGKTILPDLYRNGSYRAIYCSPSIRTIMTALYSLRNINASLEQHERFKIIIVPWISEKRNNFGDYDKQNGLMPPNNLKLATDTIKTWMETEFSDIFIDNEFYSILLEVKEGISICRIKNSDKTINDVLGKKYDEILDFQKNIKQEEKFDKDNSIVFATENTKHFMINLSTFISNIKALGNTDLNKILQKLDKFTSRLYLRGPEIDFEYYSENYSKAIDIQKKCEQSKKYAPYYKNFFDDFINGITDARYNILVYSHGGIIKEIISDMDPSNKGAYKDEINHPKNTNIVLTQYKSSIQDIFKIQYINVVSPKLLAEDSENGCDKIHDIFDRINKIYDYNKPISQDKYNKLSQEDQNQIIQENILVNDMSRHQIIRNKYLKYKNKYLELKKLL